MKYRVRIDLSFDPVSGTGEDEARALMQLARGLAAKAVNINWGRDNAEISYLELELCRHDEGLPCTRLERVEVGNRP